MKHLYSIGNSRNTVWRSLKFIRTIIKKAHREKLINDDPFQIFQMVTYRDPVKQYLIKKDIEKILKYDYQDEEVRIAAV
jgi:site-specific recombinase XerD